MSAFTPTKADRFTFGLWTVGNPGRDPFGDPVRRAPDPPTIVKRLAALGAWGVNLHDDDLVPFGSSAAEQGRIVREFRAALADHEMVVPMATVNLFTHPIFKDGGFTANDPRVRAFTLQKTMKAIDLAVELGAGIFVLWGGREGVEVDASKDPRDALARYRDGLDFLCEYVRDQKYAMVFALEAKPNEPRSDIYLPTTGHMLAFIETLAHPEMVGVNPEVAHEQMSGLNFAHGIAQALDAGKLFHIDLNDQKPGRYDQDLRFGSESLKQMFFLVKLLEEAGYRGPLHFDAHAYRSEDAEGVWAFAAGCMRTYLILKDKARRFAADAEIQGILAELRGPAGEAAVGTFTRDGAAALKTRAFDVPRIAERGLHYERLDQLVVDLLLGVR
ncbi:MAG TPA: xylose isomerase [Kofleriaceae bacterium]|nr:xylose isomerase [Kofleriaceae bacterium]